MDNEDSTARGPMEFTTDASAILLPRRKWRDAFRDKAVLLDWNFGHQETTRGYRIFWVLWSADIWFGRFPLLKFILAVNVVVWILQFVF